MTNHTTDYMTDYITLDEIEQASKLGACEMALRWLESEPRTFLQTANRYGDWLLEYAVHLLTPDRLNVHAIAIRLRIHLRGTIISH